MKKRAFDIHMDAQQIGREYENFVHLLRSFAKSAREQGYSLENTRATLLLNGAPLDLVAAAIAEEMEKK